MIGSLLALGFLYGLRHALDADHVAAMAALVSRSPSPVKATRLGLVWGLGHTLTLLVFGMGVMLLERLLSQRLALLLESAVGGMLVLLGGELLWRMVRDRIHIHAHRHVETDHYHLHFHSHSGEVGHDPVQHRHPHADAGLPRAFLVGLMHGMAGSAALVLLAPGPLHSFTTGLEYLLVFGLGSTLGMGLISVVISLPLRFASHTLTSYYHLLQGLIGGGTVAMGGWMLLTLFPRLLN